jgi:hypothetical protein
VLTERSPGACRQLETQHYVEQTRHETGTAAVKLCERTVVEAPHERGKVSEVEVHGLSATAKADIKGGAIDGQTILVALVKDAGRWKLDEIVRFIDLDRPRVLNGVEESLVETFGGKGVEPGLLHCIVEQLGSLPDARLEDVVIGPDPQAILVNKTEACIAKGAGVAQ